MIVDHYTSGKSNLEKHRAIPAELTVGRQQWVGHDSKKRPLNPETGRIFPTDPERPWVTSPEKWSSFEAAAALAERGKAAGVGFVLTRDDPYICLDLDGVRDAESGEVESWADALVERFQSYTEISLSGRGIHIFIASDSSEALHTNRWILDGHEIEVYEHGRYIAVTGNVYRFDSIEDRTEELAELTRDASAKGQNPANKNEQAEKEKHAVNTEEMLTLFSKLGVKVDPRLQGDLRCECPFHDSDKHPGRGGNSLLIHPTNGWMCWSECGDGGAGKLKDKIRLLSDDELADVSRRTGKPVEKLLALREELLDLGTSAPEEMDNSKSLDPDRIKHYLRTMQGRDGKLEIGFCGKYLHYTVGSPFGIKDGDTAVIRHQPCGRWDCHYCGPRRRTREELVLGVELEKEAVLYHQVISENQWRQGQAARRKRLSRAKAKHRYFKTRQFPGQLEVFSTVPITDDAIEVHQGERAALLSRLLEDLRKQKESGERLVDGSRKWSTTPKRQRRKAEEEKVHAMSESFAGDKETIFRCFTSCNASTALKIAMEVGLTEKGKSLDWRQWPDGRLRPAMVRFEITHPGRYQEFTLRVKERMQFKRTG